MRKFDAQSKDKHALWYYNMAIRIINEEMDWQTRLGIDRIKPSANSGLVGDYATALGLIEFCKKNIPGSEVVIEPVDSANDTIRFFHKIRFNGVSAGDRRMLTEKLRQSCLCNLVMNDEATWNRYLSFTSLPPIRK